MNLIDYLDEKKLQEHLDNGYVTMNFHKTLPLAIFNYSRKTVREQLWDDVTTKTRGLIVHIDTGEIVARPFEKFFDFGDPKHPETLAENLPQTNPVVVDKVNGSLGILYRYEDMTYIASKGSFHSKHADWANDWYNKQCPNPQWPHGYTPVFEMVCESIEKHVVDYGGQERLVLLALINIETGEEADYNTLYHYAYLNGLTVPQIYGYSWRQASLEILKPFRNVEGFVLSWPRPGQAPIKVRMKFVEYLRLRRIVKYTKPIDVLDAYFHPHLRAYLDEWINHTTPEFGAKVKELLGMIRVRHFTIKFDSAMYYAEVCRGRGEYTIETRSEWAKVFNQSEYAPVLFAKLDDDKEKIKKATYDLLAEFVEGFTWSDISLQPSFETKTATI